MLKDRGSVTQEVEERERERGKIPTVWCRFTKAFCILFYY